MTIQISPKNVVGRDRLIARIWSQLETNSLRFTAERRIGKTTVMKKLEAEPRDGVSIVYIDLERVDSPKRFTEILLEALKPLVSKKASAKNYFSSLLNDLGGTEVAGIVKLPGQKERDWQAPLERAFEGISRHNPDLMIVILADELPYMLQKISEFEKGANSATNNALSLLDCLRAALAAHSNLRMIFAGSVGLHHVLQELQGDRFASQPFNQMPKVEIGPLAQADAVDLATRLLEDDAVVLATGENNMVAQRVAELADRVPFYIERIVARLAELQDPVDIETVERTVLECLTDDRDDWEMEHFRRRIDIYYPTKSAGGEKPEPSNAVVAREVLDILALATEARSIDQIWNELKARLALDDRDRLIGLLRSLALDHYLKSDTEKRYEFRFPLLKKWWNLAQGLSS